MRNNLTLIFLMIHISIFAQLPTGLVVLQGEQKTIITKSEMSIEMDNRPFAIRYNIAKGEGTPLVSFFADKAAFDRLGHESSEEEKHTFQPGCTAALGVSYKSYFVAQAEYDYQGNYYLAEYANKIDSLSGVDRYEFVVNQIEGVDISSLFLENLYVALFFDKNRDFKFDGGELIKLTLHFANSKHNREIAEDIINLEQIDFETFDAETFYKDAVAEQRIFRGYVKKNGFQYNKYSKEDSAYVQFEPGLCSSLMESVVFRSLRFPIMEATTTLDGHTMAVAAVSSYNSKEEVQKTYRMLVDEYGEPEKGQEDNRVSATWNLPNRVIQLSLEDVVQDDKVLVRVFIASQEYVDKVKGVLSMGIWYRFE